MELAHPSANSTSAATSAPVRGDQPNTFNWTNPRFLEFRSSGPSANSTRVPGVVHSHRARWTKEKHARILAEIKATRTDLDPSFPRPVPLTATPPKSSENCQLTDVIGHLAQRTKSYFDSLTGHALELYYGGESPNERRAKFVLKCYGATSIAEPSELLDLMAFRGIPVNHPRREIRCLLASHIARELFGWDITPEASLAFVGGSVCVVTPRAEGVVLGEFFKNNLRLFSNYLGSVSEKSQHLDTWNDRFRPDFKKDYTRLALFAKVVGDVDRHLGQFLVSTENRQLLSITGIDWDMAFSSSVNVDRCTLPGGVLAWWPEPIPQDICDEFNKVTDSDLKAMAMAFEMSPAEVDALLSRFHDVKAHLATIRKT